MRSVKKTAICCAAIVLGAVLIIGTVLIADNARNEKSRYIEAEKKLALEDLCVALREMEYAVENGDTSSLSFAAGRAEAYLSRAGLGDVGEIYSMIRRIASGECGIEECNALAEAAKKALEGDKSGLLRFRAAEKREAESDAETTEDTLALRMLERIGKSRDDVALSHATAFSCPNAVFEQTESTGCFKYSGDNVFIAVGGSSNRVLMYCFERGIDPRYSVGFDEALDTALNTVKKEKLKLSGEPQTELADGILSCVWYAEDEPSVRIEVYTDTGRLRLYNAVNYYNTLN